MSAGDYLHYQFQYRRKIADLTILAATDDQTDLLTVKSGDHRIYIQRIVVSLTTYSAKTWTFQDDANTPVEIAHLSIPASAPTAGGDSGTIVWDFGPVGTPLTLGKNLDLAMSAAGAAGTVHIEGYEKMEGAVAVASTN